MALTPLQILQRDKEAAAAYAEKASKERARQVLVRAQLELNQRIQQAVGRGLESESFTVQQMQAALAQVRAVLKGTLIPGLMSNATDLGKKAAEQAAQSAIEYIERSEQLHRGNTKPLPIDTASLIDTAVSGASSTILRRIATSPEHPAKAGVLARYGANVIGEFEGSMQQRLIQGKSWAEAQNDLTAASPFLQGKPAFWSERILRTECLVGSTPVDAAVVTAAFRRWYEGPVVEVITKGGRHFTTTPNHPMLTTRAWVSSGEIEEGDYLVCSGRNQDSGSTRHQHVQAAPSTIGQLFDSLAAVGIRERRRTTQPDFHGDGADGYVDVASPDGPLVVGNFAPIFQPTAKQFLTPANWTNATFCPRCHRLLSAQKQHCLCTATAVNAGLVDSVLHHIRRNTEAFRDGFHALAHLVTAHDFHGANVLVQANRALSLEAVSHGLSTGSSNAGPSSPTRHCSGINAQPLRNDHTTQPRGVELDRVVEKRVKWFAGHVYNLSTPYGYYTINAAYTGNTMNVHNAAAQQTLDQVNDIVGGMLKILSATFDNRTASDSYAVHGQIRRSTEPFHSWLGAYMHPPNRPNDREVVVPHNMAWPIPPALEPMSDAAVAARWAQEGRKSAMPPRPNMSTVDRRLIGKPQAAAPMAEAAPAPTISVPQQAPPLPPTLPVNVPAIPPRLPVELPARPWSQQDLQELPQPEPPPPVLSPFEETVHRVQAELARALTPLSTPMVESAKEVALGDGSNVNVTKKLTWLDANKKRVQGVWKPVAGEADDLRNNIKAGTYHKREAAVFALDQLMGGETVVPPTLSRTYKGEVGSLQQFRPGMRMAKTIVRDGLELNVEHPSVRRMALLDFISANTDRHSGNWMANAKGKAIAIDNGLALPNGPPERFLLPGRARHHESLLKLDPAQRAMLTKLDPEVVAKTLLDCGIEPTAVKGAVLRTASLKKDPDQMERDFAEDSKKGYSYAGAERIAEKWVQENYLEALTATEVNELEAMVDRMTRQ